MSAARARASAWLFAFSRGASHAADLLELGLQAELIQQPDRQRREYRDALMQHPVGLLEGQRDLGRRALGCGRIGNAPMARHRLARPDRTSLARGVVADGEDEIENRRARVGEFTPGLGAKARDVVAEALQEPAGFRGNPP